MAWQGIEGHDAIADRFRAALGRGRLASTFLFVGPSGIGKRMFAQKLAQSLFCQSIADDPLAPCGRCSGCVQSLAGSHPDLHVIRKPVDKGTIPLAAIIGDDEHRMREGLCHEIALKPFMGGRRVAIIEDADFLNEEGANALLKTLEEPPPRSVLILIAANIERQLPTIRSRSQIVRFAPLDASRVARVLEHTLGMTREEAARLAPFAEGSIERALEMNDPELWAFRESLVAQLAERPLRSGAVASFFEAFVNEAGSDAGARRNRCRMAMNFALESFRASVFESVGASSSARGLDVRDNVVESADVETRGGESVDLDQVDLRLALVDRTLDALGQIDRNANQSTLIAGWLDAIASMVDSGSPPIRFQLPTFG